MKYAIITVNNDNNNHHLQGFTNGENFKKSDHILSSRGTCFLVPLIELSKLHIKLDTYQALDIISN